MSKFCSQCGNQVADESRFCSSCGNDTQATVAVENVAVDLTKTEAVNLTKPEAVDLSKPAESSFPECQMPAFSNAPQAIAPVQNNTVAVETAPAMASMPTMSSVPNQAPQQGMTATMQSSPVATIQAPSPFTQPSYYAPSQPMQKAPKGRIAVPLIAILIELIVAVVGVLYITGNIF